MSMSRSANQAIAKQHLVTATLWTTNLHDFRDVYDAVNSLDFTNGFTSLVFTACFYYGFTSWFNLVSLHWFECREAPQRNSDHRRVGVQHPVHSWLRGCVQIWVREGRPRFQMAPCIGGDTALRALSIDGPLKPFGADHRSTLNK